MQKGTVQYVGESAGDPIIELRNASVRFDSEGSSTKVLDDVNLDVYRDEVLGIIGESGSGKSMCAFAMLDAIQDPGILTGEVRYHRGNGETVDILALDEEGLKEIRWEEISIVVQGAEGAFNPTMTMRAHFEETIRQHDAGMDERIDHARELLRDLNLNPDRVFDSYPHELSGGMNQRVLIALSLVLEPNVLIMDEPTAALDLLMQRSILELLHDLKAKYDLTIVFITHDLPLLSDLADRLASMYTFQIVETGPLAEVITDGQHPYTRALINAVPNVDGALSEMRPIPGQAPDVHNVPEGCSYHPRCPMADEQCEADEPPLEETANGRATACHYWEQTDVEVPLTAKPENADLEEATR
jgi:oligopeptide/dipeptide ABC transporter ATP-binding protein